MPNQTWWESTEIELESSSTALAPGWSEATPGSDISRTGDLVVLSMQVKNVAEPEWLVGTTYAANAIVARTGSTYKSIAGGNVGNDPATDAGVHWTLITASPTKVCTLPPEFRPAATTVTPDGKFSVASTGVVTATVALTAEPGSFLPLQLAFRATTVNP